MTIDAHSVNHLRIPLKLNSDETFKRLKKHPITFAPNAAKDLNTSVPTARAALETLVQLEIITVMQLDRKQKVYAVQKYLDLLIEKLHK